ncbi:hypothetical protein EDD11_004900 [Mortierella claussenii]|nr:hypothetical protein EDD11_004900 [Mortierella claussenii]
MSASRRGRAKGAGTKSQAARQTAPPESCMELEQTAEERMSNSRHGSQERQGQAESDSDFFDASNSEAEGSQGEPEQDGGDGETRSASASTPAGTPKPKVKRGKRGKYKPRDPKSWADYFATRKLVIKDDGSATVEHSPIDTRRIHSASRWRSVASNSRGQARKKWGQTSQSPTPESSRAHATGFDSGIEDDDDEDDEVEDVQNRVAGRDRDAKPREDTAFSVYGRLRERLVTDAAQQQLAKDMEDGRWPDWALAPPLAQYPYLQEAFPFEEYDTPKNRVETAWLDPAMSPMGLEWYGLQGPVVNEDLFSKDKFEYATNMLRKVDVEDSKLRMEMYFYRGFELASRKVLDRVRINNAAEKKLTSTLEASQNNIALSSATSAQGGQPRPTQAPSTLSLVAPDPLHQLMSSSSTPASASVQSRTKTSNAIADPGTTTNPTIVNTTTEPNSSQEDDATVALTDYYQVNQLLATLFQPGENPDTPIPLTAGARRIVATMLAGLESKLNAMGCHRQRMELTRRLGMVDHEEVLMKASMRKNNTDTDKVRKQLGLPSGLALPKVPKGTSTLPSAQEQSIALAAETPNTGADDSARVSDRPEGTEARVVDSQPISSSSAMPPPLFAPKKPKRIHKSAVVIPVQYEKKMDMDQYIFRLQDRRSGKGKTSSREASRAPDPIAASPSLSNSSSTQTPSASSISFPSDRGPSRVPSVSLSEQSAEDEQDDNAIWSSKPFVSNPLRIPQCMDPFFKAREFLQARSVAMRTPPVEASSSTSRSLPRASMRAPAEHDTVETTPPSVAQLATTNAPTPDTRTEEVSTRTFDSTSAAMSEAESLTLSTSELTSMSSTPTDKAIPSSLQTTASSSAEPPSNVTEPSASSSSPLQGGKRSYGGGSSSKKKARKS